jgi:hypothetical protein
LDQRRLEGLVAIFILALGRTGATVTSAAPSGAAAAGRRGSIGPPSL